MVRASSIVVDELGKFLEFAAHHPDENDMFLLQLLAEATVGSAKPDLLLVTILHQAFDQYASGLRPVLRNEWAKVQGRFQDVAFQVARRIPSDYRRCHREAAVTPDERLSERGC